MARLDYFDILPDGMVAYLSNHGYHFSKAMCKWAVGHMRDMNDNPVDMPDKKFVDDMLKKFGVELKNDNGYDSVFIYCMGISDYITSSIPDEAHIAKYIKDVLDDNDGYDGVALTRFLSDCNGKGISIPWPDLI